MDFWGCNSIEEYLLASPHIVSSLTSFDEMDMLGNPIEEGGCVFQNEVMVVKQEPVTPLDVGSIRDTLLSSPNLPSSNIPNGFRVNGIPQLLNDVKTNLKIHQNHHDKINILSPNLSPQELESEAIHLENKLNSELNEIQELQSTVPLWEKTLLELNHQEKERLLLLRRLELQKNYATHVASNANCFLPLAAIFISKAPFPIATTERTFLPDSIEVQVLQAPCTEIHVDSIKPVVVEMPEIEINFDKKQNNRNQETTILFNKLRFKQPSHLEVVHIRFEAEITQKLARKDSPKIKIKLTSGLSRPLVIMANKGKQWENAHEKILQHCVFSSQPLGATENPEVECKLLSTVPPARFINGLEFFLKVVFARYAKVKTGDTQQDGSVARGLSIQERDFLWDYLFHSEEAATTPSNHRNTNRKRNHNTISVKPFPRNEADPQVGHQLLEWFWGWFGKGLFLFRDEKNLPLWTEGKVVGFVSRAQAELLLREQPEVGRFLLRFSTTKHDQLVLSWTAEDGSIVHSFLLIKDGRRSIAELLFRNKAKFNVLRRIMCLQGEGQNQRFCTLDKNCLRSYVLKTHQGQESSTVVPSKAIVRSIRGYTPLPEDCPNQDQFVLFPRAAWEKLQSHPSFKAILQEITPDS